MNDLDTRLRRCFSTAFPNLAPEAIPSAEQTKVEAWDSVAAITLIALIEEEFATPIDFEALPELTSYRALREYLERA